MKQVAKTSCFNLWGTSAEGDVATYAATCVVTFCWKKDAETTAETSGKAVDWFFHFMIDIYVTHQ